MNSETNLIYHGLAIKKHARPTSIAELIGWPEERVERRLDEGVRTGRVVEISGSYTLAPLARIALEADYSREYSGVRRDETFLAAYHAFERLNIDLKSLITDWQSMSVGGQTVPNDHRDKAYDLAIIGRLGDVQDRIEPILDRMSIAVPRLVFYKAALAHALEQVESGSILWVSDVKIASYHTVWFELHEDLLRMTGNVRVE